MSKIYLLSDTIISKIAAGEVIERPVYAVKELIENAIDANADTINIHITDSGLKKIVVNDNGEGMDYEDIQQCFKPHTTSKISSEEELHGIHTLGFRGEALASIAAISNMSIKSKTKDATSGSLVELVSGKVENISLTGMPQGTSVSVDNLFYPVPGRKKFLKSLRTEYRHILDLMTHFVLSYPDIHFTFSHNEKVIFDLPKKQDISERILLLFGNRVVKQLLKVSHRSTYLTINGFIGYPQYTTQNSSKQFLFINKRKITDKVISLAVKEAYGNLIESHALPVFILFLSLPYEAVDVNVHPRKEQIHFVDTKSIFDEVYKAVTDTLQNNNLTFFNLSMEDGIASRKGNLNSFAGKYLKEKVSTWEMNNLHIQKDSSIQQVHNLYLIVQTKNGLLFVDQHAAHERILYEQFLEQFQNKSELQEQYILEKPLSFDLSFSDSELLKEKQNELSSLGFAFESKEDNIVHAIAVPLLFKDRKIPKLVNELLDELREEKSYQKIDNQSQRMLAYLACRSAIKAGDSLTKQQAKELLEKLEKTKNNATCPHGRPTKVEIPLPQIHKYFKRV